MSQKKRPVQAKSTAGSSEFLYMANNVRKNLLRMYRRKKWKISPVYYIVGAVLYYELLLRLYGGSFFSHIIYPILFGLAGGLLVAAAGTVLPKKWSRRMNLAVLFILSLVFTVACLVQANYKVYMSPGSIFSGTGNVTGQYKTELFFAIVKGIPTIVLFFLPALFYLLTGRRRVPARRYPPIFGCVLALAGILVFGVGCLAGSHGGTAMAYKGGVFDTNTRTFGLLTAIRLDGAGGTSSGGFDLPDEPETPDAPQTAVVSVGDGAGSSQEAAQEAPVTYGQNVMELDLDTLINSGDSDVSEISQYIKSLTPASQNKYTGIFEGKNLILIAAEGFSDYAVDEKMTPTLYRLMHNGIYFSDFYQPTWGGSTSSGEFSLVFGIAPENGAETVHDSAANNNYFTLGNQLQRLGYYSAAFHNGAYDTYARDETHTNLGYATWTAFNNGLEDLTDWDNSDTTMFDKTLDTYIDMQPFSVYYMTISGHCPYIETSRYVEKYYDQVKAYYGDKYLDTTLYYLCYQQELENALTQMVKRLEDAGIADDTVIVMTADHYPYGLQESSAFQTDQDYLLDFYGDDYNESDWKRDHNGAIIWSGSLEHDLKEYACEVSAPSFSLDLLPTVSNMFGLEYDSRLLVGRDVFSDQEAIVFWNSYSWGTEYGFYSYAEKKFYPKAGCEDKVDDAYIDRITRIVANKISYSAKVIAHNYWGTLFGPDTDTDNPAWVEERRANPQSGNTAPTAEETPAGTDDAAADTTSP